MLSLKSQLSRELRNVKKSRSGDGADDIRISEWEHWDSLQFLVPAITPGKSVDSIQVIESTSAKDSSHHTPEKISKSYDNKRKLKSTPLSEKRLKALMRQLKHTLITDSPIEAHFNNSRTNFNAFSPTVDNIIRSSRNSSF